MPDGQQRLTSVFTVFQTELIPENPDWSDVYFDMAAAASPQDSFFVAISEEQEYDKVDGTSR